MIAIASRDKLAINPMGLFAFTKTNVRSITVNLLGQHFFCFINNNAIHCISRIEQISSDFSLAVDHDRCTAGKLCKVNMMATIAKSDIESLMDQTLAIHPLRYTGFAHKVHQSPLKNTSTNTTQHIITTAFFDNDCINASHMQQLRKQKARWARTNNGNLRFRVGILSW